MPSVPEDWRGGEDVGGGDGGGGPGRQALVDLMFRCWASEPRQRPSFPVILGHLKAINVVA